VRSQSGYLDWLHPATKSLLFSHLLCLLGHPFLLLTVCLLYDIQGLRAETSARTEEKTKKGRGGRGDAAFSIFMRFLNSNRGTYEKLEIVPTCTKQKIGFHSNRGNLGLSSRISSCFRALLLATIRPGSRSLPRCGEIIRNWINSLKRNHKRISNRKLSTTFSVQPVSVWS
jgi:hypothetical protein